MPSLRVAVVGSGPSGFYAAEGLLRSGLSVGIDMFERLPVPYGLVRFGVAPDHPKLKLVTAVFDRIASMPGFRFVGGVEVGTDVTIDTLRSCYHAVILATGADVSRRMNISGEALAGCHAASDFVAWYNGHPDFRDHRFDLSGERAVIIGHGNVALDVARILVKTADELRHTDIADHAIEAIAESRIREVAVVGRRGLAGTHFSAKELEEFLDLADCNAALDATDLCQGDPEVPDNAAAEMNTAAAILARFASRPTAKRKQCLFRFGLEPVALHGTKRVERMIFQRRGEACRAAGAASVVIDCNLVFASIGRRAAPVPQIPYDEERGVQRNIGGRVTRDGSPVRGLYVCGWAKRGATGTIGTNRGCSIETVAAVLADLHAVEQPTPCDPEKLIHQLSRAVATHVDYAGWQRIDAEEIRLGKALGRPRLKLTSIAQLLSVAKNTA